MKKIALASFLALAGISAQAQSVYADVAYQIHDADFATDAATVRGIVGYQVNPNLSAELLLGLSARESKETLFGVQATAKVDRMFGVYGKYTFPVNNSFDLYGRLGFVSSKVKATAGGFTESESGSGISYGVGASYKITPALSLNVDYMDYDDLEGGVALGVKFNF